MRTTSPYTDPAPFFASFRAPGFFLEDPLGALRILRDPSQRAGGDPTRRALAERRGVARVYVCAVRMLSVAEAIALLEEQVKAEPGGAIAFDGDGTLWSGDIGEDFFEALLDEGALSESAHSALAQEASEHGLDATGGAVAIGRRIHAAYQAGTFPEERVCEIMAWACAGRQRTEIDAFADRLVGEKLGLDARLHAEAIDIVAWARDRGVATFLVSASPRAIVEQAARLVGIPLANVASATEEVDAQGIVQPRVVRPIPYGAGKVMHLRTKLGARMLYAAFGDNAFDVPMLQEARLPIAIRPKPRLLERASEVASLATLAQRA